MHWSALTHQPRSISIEHRRHCFLFPRIPIFCSAFLKPNPFRQHICHDAQREGLRQKIDVRSFRLTSFRSCMFGIKANLYSENYVYLRKISRLWNYTSVLRRKSDLHRFTRPSGTVTVRHTVPNLRLAQAAACFPRNTGRCEVLICKRFFTRSHRHRFRSGAISVPKPPLSIQTTNSCLSEF